MVNWRSALHQSSQRAAYVIAARCVGLRTALRFSYVHAAITASIACIKDIRPAGFPPLKSLRTPGKILAETGKDIVFTHPEP